MLQHPDGIQIEESRQPASNYYSTCVDGRHDLGKEGATLVRGVHRHVGYCGMRRDVLGIWQNLAKERKFDDDTYQDRFE